MKEKNNYISTSFEDLKNLLKNSKTAELRRLDGTHEIRAVIDGAYYELAEKEYNLSLLEFISKLD